MYHAKFAKLKEEGGSDKLVEAKVKSDPDVVEARSHCAVARHKVRILQQHLRAWDKNHDNSQSRGHMIRKELDKLHQELLRPNNSVEDEFERIVGGTSNG